MNHLVTHARSVAPVRPSREAGFTLIEMLISITIGLGILAGLVAFWQPTPAIPRQTTERPN